MFTQFNQFIQNQRSLNENYNQSYRAEFRTNFRDAPNVEIGYRYSISDNDQGQSRTKFYTKAPSIEFDAYIWKKLTFRTDYSYNNFSDEEGTIIDFQLWNASLSYRKNKDAAFARIQKMLDGVSHVGWRESLHENGKWRNEDCLASLKAVQTPMVSAPHMII